MGRDTKDSAEVRATLMKEFADGATDEEACFVAGISVATLRLWKEKDPQLADKIKRIKDDVAMQETIAKRKAKRMAKIQIYAAVDNGDVNTCKWLAERLCKEDFSNTLEIKQTEPIKVFITPEQHAAALEHINQVINSET